MRSKNTKRKLGTAAVSLTLAAMLAMNTAVYAETETIETDTTVTEEAVNDTTETEDTENQETETGTGEDFLEDAPEAIQPGLGAINENLYGVSREEMIAYTGIDLPAPKGAEQVVYNVIDPNGEYPISEMQFTLDGKNAYIRAQPSSLMQPTAEDGGNGYEKYNISGLYYNWDDYRFLELPFGNVFVQVDTTNHAGFAMWLDMAPGILYNVGMASDADAETLFDFAERTFSPVQGDVDADIEEPDYSRLSNWAYMSYSDKFDTDVFFVAPTAVGGENLNMEIENEESREKFTGATAMEKGIYDDNANFIAPFYRQVTLSVYDMPEEERETYLDLAYTDIKNAFDYYLENMNEDRDIVLAGFSQGGDMVKRLLIDYPEIQDKLVAAYIIGWNVTDEDLADHPYLKMAEGEEDTGVIVSFCSEVPEHETSVIVPEATNGINPLNWKTDATVADKADNEGACFPDSNGEITQERPGLCGAYLDVERGTLKVLDVTSEEYPARLTFLADGDYHLYDYQFFYRNLEENVQKRIEKFAETK